MNVLLVVSIALSVVVTSTPILYTVWFKWHQTPLGRALFMKALALAVVVDFSTIRLIMGSDLYWARTAVFAALLVTQALLLGEMLRIKMSTRKMNGVVEREPFDHG